MKNEEALLPELLKKSHVVLADPYNHGSHWFKVPPIAGGKQMAKIQNNQVSEAELGLAVLRVLATRPHGEASIAELVKEVPQYLKLPPADMAQSPTRQNEQIWEQRVRNLKSHDKTEGNILREGYATHTGKGTYQISDAGRRYLSSKGL